MVFCWLHHPHRLYSHVKQIHNIVKYWSLPAAACLCWWWKESVFRLPKVPGLVPWCTSCDRPAACDPPVLVSSLVWLLITCGGRGAGAACAGKPRLCTVKSNISASDTNIYVTSTLPSTFILLGIWNYFFKLSARKWLVVQLSIQISIQTF